ncbi:putative RNA helicase [Helianthus debilis subsp. tardiflorus]
MENSDAETEDELKKKNDFYIEVEEYEEDSHNIQSGFEDFNLSPELMKALYEDMKFVRPSKIQSMCLPKILINSTLQEFDRSGTEWLRKDTLFCARYVQLFSATFSDAVKDFVSTLENDLFVPEFRQLFVKKQKLSLGSVKQYKVNVRDELSKIMVIKDKILELGDGVWQAIIFVRAIKGVETLHEALVNDGYAVATIKGSLSYKEQEKLIKEFKYGWTRILISAGFLAPGIDHSLVNLVVNYDLPVLTCNSTQPDYQSYLRRIGRAGRFGRKGM